MKQFIAFIVMICLVLGIGCTPPATQTNLTGTVQKIDDTFVLMADDETQYKLEGGDFSANISQRITVTGTVLDDGQGKVISVLSYEPEE